MTREKNKQGYVIKPSQRLLIALILSLLLHLALLSSLGPTSQTYSSPSKILQVRLNSSAPPSTPEILEPHLTMTDELAQSRQDTVPPIKTAEYTASTKPDEFKVAQPTSSVSSAQSEETSKETDQQSSIQLPAHNAPPQWVEIEFEIFSGTSKAPMGSGLQHYESDNSGHYQLSFKDTTKTALTPSQDNHWQLQIEGKITRNGLSPSSYRLQGRLVELLMALNNDSSNATPSSDSLRKGHMPDGILDRFSMPYQFMFLPPKDSGGQLLLTDGEELGTYTYHVVGTESLDIPSLGIINTLHLTFAGSENLGTTELWLAKDFSFLPVKIHYTDSRGNIIEQIATSLNAK